MKPCHARNASGPALACLAALLLAACATAPEPLRGEFTALTPMEAGRGGATGERVRWGGRIVETTPDAARTCFEVLGMPLGDSARPRGEDQTLGRFLACREGFYDPAVFAAEREITVVGSIEDVETRAIGEYPYPYPRVAADVVFLWPEREDTEVYYVGTLGFYPHPYGWGSYRLRPWHLHPKAAPAPREQPGPERRP